jgi:hypothetical protein
MTPLGRGYFLGPDGEIVSIFEHLASVEAEPQRFGLRPEDVAYKDDEERRTKGARRARVLSMVLRNGFSRVRLHKDRNVIEFFAETPEDETAKRALIASFLRRQGVMHCVVKNVAERPRSEG